MFWSKSRKSPRREEKPVRRPLVEVLENRQLLSTSIFVAGGTLEPITENQPVTNNTIARVAAYDAQNHALTDLSGFTAKINWGDGTDESDGTIGPNAGGNYYAIEGSHTYATAGNYPISVHVVAGDGTSADDYAETAHVQDANLSTTPKLVQATAGQEFTNTLAILTDANTASRQNDFTADISWGDSTQTDNAQIVSVGAGQYQLIGTHIYARPGMYYASVSVTDEVGTMTSTTCVINVATAPSPSQPTDPTSPTDPTIPTTPGSPQTPSTPSNPTDPSQPPTAPTQPPANPTSPPTNPTPPANPTTPPTTQAQSPATPTDPTTPDGSGPVAYGKKVSPAFKAKVAQIAAALGTDPNNLMGAMAFETGGTFSPSIRNKAGSGAVGLIQFMPATARGLKTSSAALAKMSAVQQLDYVYKYLAPYAGRLNSLSDVYMSILYPAAVGKPDSYSLFTRGTKAYSQNKGLDTNHDGVVTKGEAAARVSSTLQTGMTPAYFG